MQSSKGNDDYQEIDRTVGERSVLRAMQPAQSVALPDPSGRHRTNSLAHAGTESLLGMCPGDAVNPGWNAFLHRRHV